MSEAVTCAFCEKTRLEVAKLVRGNTGACICDECVVVAVAVMSGSNVKFRGQVTHDDFDSWMKTLRAKLKPPEDDDPVGEGVVRVRKDGRNDPPDTPRPPGRAGATGTKVKPKRDSPEGS